jgi:hypothetical protein
MHIGRQHPEIIADIVAGDFESAVEKYSCLRIKPDKNKYTRL